MFNNLKNNVKNKTWWVAVISLLLMILNAHGFDLTQYIGADWQITLNNVFTLLALIGISVDTTSVNTTQTTDVATIDTTPLAIPTEATATDANTLTATLSDTKIEQIKTILNQ